MNIDIDIDIEMLISLVENRPVLWDKTSESYKIKQLNFTAWMDICKMIHPSFDTLSYKEKNEFGKFTLIIYSLLFIKHILFFPYFR